MNEYSLLIFEKYGYGRNRRCWAYRKRARRGAMFSLVRSGARILHGASRYHRIRPVQTQRCMRSICSPGIISRICAQRARSMNSRIDAPPPISFDGSHHK